MADKTELIVQFKQRMLSVPPLEDEPDFSTSDETLARYLKSRDWKLDDAYRMLVETLKYRRETRPLQMDCCWCHKRPGYHSMRQVGHDEAGRPVIYANFAQASTHRYSSEDSVAHVTYLIENAKRTMAPGISTWVFIIDCTGMTLSSCNPKLGYSVSCILADHYPERLGLVVCLNHNPVFHGVWKAMKRFLPVNTVAKVRLVRSKAKITELFSEIFSQELSTWLLEEIALNKQKPLPKSQLEFWNGPVLGSTSHDPRGSPSYISKFILPLRKLCTTSGDQVAVGSANRHVHKPHPNIVDVLRGQEVKAMPPTPEEIQEREKAQTNNDDAQAFLEEHSEEEDGGSAAASNMDLDIPTEYQIPASALPLAASS